MTQDDWFAAKDPDAMLRLVGHRFSPRQWHLLACGVVRRAWDLLPDGPLRGAVEWVERHAGEQHAAPDEYQFEAPLAEAVRLAAEAAREAERQIVLAADPDGNPEVYDQPAVRRSNPAAQLHQLACHNARSAVRVAGQAVECAAEAVAAVLLLRPSLRLVDRVRETVTEATRVRGVANLHEATALSAQAQADEAAERANGRNAGQREAAAVGAANRQRDLFNRRNNDLYTEKTAADRKALGRLLHELAGNPFRGYPFDPRWRTSTVVGLARAIDADRGFDRMPILADALLDADCDDEAVLRHCRGTESHAPDPQHVPGCWVLDLILEREPAFFTADPIPVRRKAPRPRSRRLSPPAFDVSRQATAGRSDGRAG